jgi:hypothetical protein
MKKYIPVSSNYIPQNTFVRIRFFDFDLKVPKMGPQKLWSKFVGPLGPIPKK